MSSPAVSTDEVRAIARFPYRRHLAGFGVALLVSVLFLVLRQPTLPPLLPLEPLPNVCATEPLSEACLHTLPEDYRRLPDGERYAAWRTADLIGALKRSPEAPRTRPDAAIRRVVELLVEIDPWVRSHETAELFGRTAVLLPGDRDGRSASALLALAAERDWSAEPTAPKVTTRDTELRAVAELLDYLAGRYDRERSELNRTLGIEARRAEALRAHAELQPLRTLEAEHLRALEARRLQGYAAGLAGLFLAMSAVWWWLGPVTVIVTPHHVRIGRRSIPWSEVVEARWLASPPRVTTRERTHTLGPRELELAAREALDAASKRAAARTATLQPLDRAALDGVRKLLQ